MIPRRSITRARSCLRPRTAGVHWEAISPDLTRNDKSKQQPSGGSITIDDTGTEYYDTIFAVAESPVNEGRDLGGYGRRLGSVDTGRREELDQCHSQRSAGVEPRQPD